MQRDGPTLRVRKQIPARRKGRVLTAVLCLSIMLCLLVLPMAYRALVEAGPPTSPLAAECVEFVQTRKSALDWCAY